MNHSDNRIAHDEFSSAQGADWLRLKGRVCVVTGAGSGIGAAIAGAFSAVGAQVALLRTPRGPHSAASWRDSSSTPALLAL